MSNKQIIERIYKLQHALIQKNPLIFNALEKALVPLLEFDGEIQNCVKSDLMKFPGIGKKSAELIIEIINGKTVHQILMNMPERKKRVF